MRYSNRLYSVAVFAVFCSGAFATGPALALFNPGPAPSSPSPTQASSGGSGGGDGAVQEPKTCVDNLSPTERAATLSQIRNAYHAAINAASGCASGFNEARFSVPGQYNAIMGNSSLRLQLSANGIAVKDVVGIQVKNGRLVVHVATQ